ncbi:Tn3 family transposase [Streptomyces sp. RM72]|uniref:Tn3 family transposase n=1 Tax=Streptomyces sp. RM72 TaxID=1115510 RepID=UPI001B399736|nr:Tn3 family transposase [Streptomyces sp. RM72]MBQ0887484.1 Tn3 family transposase [Streptomyces sp. RM72]
MDDQRFWRATMPGVETGTYGAVEDLVRNRVNLNKVITHWPDMLKAAVPWSPTRSPPTTCCACSDATAARPRSGAAFAAYGWIAKTELLLRVVDPVDNTCRRQMNRQLTVQESRRTLARDVCRGERGTIDQEPRASCARCAARTRQSWTRTTSRLDGNAGDYWAV